MTPEEESVPFVVYMTMSNQEACLQLQSTIRDEWKNAVIYLFEDDTALISAIKCESLRPAHMVIFGDQVDNLK